MIQEIKELIESCTDEVIALMVIGGSMVGYFVGTVIPIELPMIILGYYFVRKNVEVNIK